MMQPTTVIQPIPAMSFLPTIVADKDIPSIWEKCRLIKFRTYEKRRGRGRGRGTVCL